jgi:hypothetical protein
MAQRFINTGTADYAGDGESLRDALIKVNDNFTEVYTDLSAVQSFDGDYNSLTNKPDLSVYALTANTFNGDYNNLTNLPDLTTLATFDGNLGTVTDVTLTNVTDGQVLTYDNTSSKWVNAAPAAGGSSFDQNLNTTDSPTFVGLTTTTGTVTTLAVFGNPTLALNADSVVADAQNGNLVLQTTDTITNNFVNAWEVNGTNGASLVLNDNGVTSSELSVNIDVIDFGTGNTIDMQNCSVLFTGATITGLDTISSIDGGGAATTYLSGDLTIDGGGA